MSASWVRALVGVVVFFVVLVIGVNVTGSLDAGTDLKDAANKVVATVIVALLLAFIAYAVVEYAQTQRLDSITSQFDTRTIVLIPIAIAINIILGQTVSAALKVPVYLDSIGTILVGVLAGPIAGAVTGGLANLIWTYVLPAPFHSDYAARVAASRPTRSTNRRRNSSASASTPTSTLSGLPQTRRQSVTVSPVVSVPPSSTSTGTATVLISVASRAAATASASWMKAP